MDARNRMARSTGLIIIGTLVGKVTGLFRDIFLARNFGTSMEADALTLSTSAILILSAIIGTGVSASFLPVAVSVEKQDGKEKKNVYTSNMLGLFLFFGIAMTVLGVIFAPQILRLLSEPKFSKDAFDLSKQLMRVGLPIIALTGIIGIFTGYLHSENRFFAVASMAVPSNLALIIYLLYISSKHGVKGYMIATIFGGVLQVAFLYFAVKKAGFKYKPVVDVKDRHVKDVILLSLPTLLGVAINDVNTIVDKRLASGLSTGRIAALNYSYKLSNLVLGVFVTATVSVIFPVLTKLFEEEKYGEGKKVMNQGIFTIMLVTIPATVGMIFLANPIIRVIYMNRAFDEKSVALTSPALIYYGMGLTTMALVLLFTRVFYSMKDTKTPMILGVFSVFINIALNLMLVKSMEHRGLALATSIASFAYAGAMYMALKSRLGDLGVDKHLVSYAKIITSSFIMGVAAYGANNLIIKMIGLGKSKEMLSLLLSIMVGVFVYAMCLLGMRTEELADVVKMFKQRFRRV